MRTSSRGNDGFAMIDALVSLFIASIAAVAVLGYASAVLRQEANVRARATFCIETRNETAFAGFELDAD